MAYSIMTSMSLRLIQTHDADDHLTSLRIAYTVNPAYPQTMLTPGEPASVQIISAEVEGGGIVSEWHEAPAWLWALIEADEALDAEMLRAAWESEEAARDDHADRLREERLLERGQ